MRPELKGLDSSDLPDGQSLPQNPDNCWIVVTASIGISGEPGADLFVFYVCTLERLRQMTETGGPVSGRHLLIVSRFDWDAVEQAIISICNEVEGDTWEVISRKLAQFGKWEYEGYPQDPS